MRHEVNPIFINKQGFFKDFSKNFIKNFSKKNAEKYLINFIEKELIFLKPDMILVISPFLLPESLSKMIESFKNSIKIGWVGDRFSEKQKEIARSYDKLYFTDSYFVEEANKFSFPKSTYLPLAYNKKVFFNKNYENRENNLLFIGTMTDERVKFINSVPNVEFKLIGKKIKNKMNNKNIEIFNKNISIKEVAQEYNRTNFVLNIKHETNVVNGLNMRTFESIACGACLLQDNLKDIEYNFEPNKDILVYDSADEISYYIEKYTKEKKMLKKILDNGQKNIESNHQYIHRIKRLLSI